MVMRWSQKIKKNATNALYAIMKKRESIGFVNHVGMKMNLQ